MLQFTEQEIQVMKKKAPSMEPVIERMKESCQKAFVHGVKVPPRTLATWVMYFICPEDSGRLIYDYSNENEYECPICHKKYHGEPYSGAWWRSTVEEITDIAVKASYLWLILEEEKYRDLAKEILLDFAKYYPNYELHGDIMYNNPGRIASQTLCEALTIRKLIVAYDMMRDCFTAEQCRAIEEDMFIQSAQVLMDQRMNQLHNHEVVIDGALGMIGMVLGREDFLDFAIESKYGLKYQLEHGLLADGFWFEGTIHYHYFTLSACMEFEKVARGTKYSLLEFPYYKKMLEVPLHYMQSDFHMPCLGDVNGEGYFEELAKYYEFPYHVYHEPLYATLLNEIYRRVPRYETEALLYGEDEIEATGPLVVSDYHDNESSGLTIMHGKNGKYLLTKHGKFGGEHDHYDKLGIHFLVKGKDVVDDLGTVFYGAPHHYGYFKNTFTHNTVCLDTVNQPPCNGKTIVYEKRPEGTFLEAHADWCHGPVSIDSLTIKQWDDAAYEGVTMRRAILFCEDYFLEAFLVKGGAEHNVDWIVHPQGTAVLPELDFVPVELGDGKPVTFMKEIKGAKREGIVKTAWTSEACTLSLYSTANVETQAIYFKGPSNPTNVEMQYFLQRAHGADEVVFMNVFETQDGPSHISDISMSYSDHLVTVDMVYDGEERTYRFEIGKDL